MGRPGLHRQEAARHLVLPLGAGLEALEAMAFAGHRWWQVDELLRCDDRVLPYRLREFLPDLAAGIVPDEPVDITHPDPPW